MAKIGFGDFINFDGKDRKFIDKIHRMEADYTASIDEMISVSRELKKELKQALITPKQDNRKITGLVTETRAVTKELKATKIARKEVNSVKKKYIELSRAEQQAITREKEATRQLRLENDRLEKLRVSEIGSLKRLRAEINLDVDALERMSLSTKKGQMQAAAFSKSIHRKTTALKSAEAAIGRYNGNVGNYPKLARAATLATSQLVAAFGLWQGIALARSIINEIKEIERLNLALKTVTKTTVEYNAAQIFLNDLAKDYGVEINSLTKTYAQFAASLRGTGISLQQGKGLFESVTKSAAVLGLTTDDTNGVLKAFRDILSKGKIQAEELRGQLGDRMSGAMQIFSQVTGKTTQELDKMLQKGELLAIDVFPKLAEGMEKFYGIEGVTKVETLTAEQNKLTNTYRSFIRSIDEGQGVISTSFKATLGFLTRVLEGLQEINKTGSLQDQILGADYFSKETPVQKGVFQIEERLSKRIESAQLAINTIESSFRKAQKTSTEKGGLEKIIKQIQQYEGIIERTKKQKFISSTDDASIKIYTFQVKRLNELLKEATENQKSVTAEAVKFSDDAEKAYRKSAISDIAKRVRDEEEKARIKAEKAAAKVDGQRLPKMKEIGQENKFQIEQNKINSSLYSEHEEKLIAIANAHEAAGESAKRSKDKSDELGIIAGYERTEQLRADVLKGVNMLVNAIDAAEQAAYERKINRIENEGRAIERNVTDQQERARLGLKNQLAFEEKELIKQELKKDRLQRRAARREKIKSFYSAFSSLLESGTPPGLALAEAGAITLSSEVFAATLKDGGVLKEAISAKGGSGKYGNINNGYVTGVSHNHASGGIPVLMEGEEAIISGKGMQGFESPEQFKGFHSFLKGGGKYNDLIKNSGKSIVAVRNRGNDNKEVVNELKGLRREIANLEPPVLDADFLSEIAKIHTKVTRQGKTIETIINGGSSKGRTNNR